MMWLLVCWLEICGVTLGTWQWSAHLPHTAFTEGNPPTGLPGGYGLMDLIAFSLVTGAYKLSIIRQRQLQPG